MNLDLYFYSQCHTSYYDLLNSIHRQSSGLLLELNFHSQPSPTLSIYMDAASANHNRMYGIVSRNTSPYIWQLPVNIKYSFNCSEIIIWPQYWTNKSCFDGTAVTSI